METVYQVIAAIAFSAVCLYPLLPLVGVWMDKRAKRKVKP